MENGRWGPYIKYVKAVVNLPRVDGAKMTSDQARALTLEDVKAIIKKEIPDAFEAKPKAKPKAKTKK